MRFTADQIQKHNRATNNEGGMSYNLTPEQELVKMALTSFVDKSFYEKMDDKVARLRQYCGMVNSQFLLKLAVRARQKGLRTVTQIMMINALNDKSFYAAFQALVKRPDEIIDILGYYIMVNGQHPDQIKLDNQLKKAIKAKLESFSEYQLAKYKGKGDVINLYDLVHMTHAKGPNIDKLMQGQLQIADTRESELSAKGNTIESRKRLLDEKKLGALAFVRNLRNMIQCGVGHRDLREYLEKLDFKKVFPFQVIQAADIAVQAGLDRKSPLYKALETKIYDCFDNFIKLFHGKVAIGVDISGSMQDPINSKSTLKRIILGAYYGMALQSRLHADLYLRHTQCFKALPTVSIQEIKQVANGGTTPSIFPDSVKGMGYDTMLVITDEQQGRNGRSFDQAVRECGIGNVIVRNLADNDKSMIPTFDKGYTYITGFNDAQFELVDDLRDLKGLVNAINALSITGQLPESTEE